MKTTQTCPQCFTVFTRVWAKNRNPPMYCCRSCASKNLPLMLMSSEERARYIKHGPAHHNWKGGVYRSRAGYIMVGPNLKTKRSHIVWDAAHPDDPIKPGEIIHHINHVRDDDRPENLQKLPSHSAHAKVHDGVGGSAGHSKEVAAKRGAAQRAKTWAKYGWPYPCEQCGKMLTHAQMLERNRFCSKSCRAFFMPIRH